MAEIGSIKSTLGKTNCVKQNENGFMLNPEMPDEEIRLHMGEMSASEIRVARAAIRWANSRVKTSCVVTVC